MHHKGTIRSSFGTRFGPDSDSSALFVAHAETQNTGFIIYAKSDNQVPR